MRLSIRLFALIAVFICLPSTALGGMVQVQSQYDVRATSDRLIAAVRVQGLNFINRIEYAEDGSGEGKDDDFAEVVIFDNPHPLTSLTECSQSANIERSHKAMIWEDSEGNVWLGYNNPVYAKKRFRLNKCDFEIRKVEKTLVSLAKLATQPTPQQ